MDILGNTLWVLPEGCLEALETSEKGGRAIKVMFNQFKNIQQVSAPQILSSSYHASSPFVMIRFIQFYCNKWISNRRSLPLQEFSLYNNEVDFLLIFEF